MKASGNRAAWLSACAAFIMDGGTNPPSIERLHLLVPDKVGTSINDGHVTAAKIFGEDKKDDYRAGQKIFVEEIVQVLRDQKFIEGDNSALRWIKPLDGEFQIEIDGHTYTIYGQRERRMSRDRAMLGEREEETDALIGPPGTFISGKAHPLEVQVIGPRGGVEKMKLEVHPFALALPPMTEREREGLRASIERDGVKVPLVIYQKKILDGRNRGYYAAVLNKPVRIETFTGTDEEAKRYVAILNLHRRHLSIAQQANILIAMFGEQARKEASARISPGRPSKKSDPNSGPILNLKHERSWAGRLAAKAKEFGMPNVTRHAIESMAEVMPAPKTLAKVMSGEIKSVAEANKQAREEMKLPATILPRDIDNRSIMRRLGRAIDELSKILSDCNGEMPVGQMPEMISPRLDEIERLVPQVKAALRRRNIIP
jgi:hypothetical protein